MRHHIRRFHAYRSASRLVAILILLGLTTGCSVLPTDRGSRYAEGAWQTLHAIDTMQTYQIAKNPHCFREANGMAAALYGSDRPKPERVLLVNIAGSLVHAQVSRWLDDRTDAAFANESDTRGVWAVGRIAYHTVSLLWSASAVANNYELGLRPGGATCP